MCPERSTYAARCQQILRDMETRYQRHHAELVVTSSEPTAVMWRSYVLTGVPEETPLSLDPFSIVTEARPALPKDLGTHLPVNNRKARRDAARAQKRKM